MRLESSFAVVLLTATLASAAKDLVCKMNAEESQVYYLRRVIV